MHNAQRAILNRFDFPAWPVLALALGFACLGGAARADDVCRLDVAAEAALPALLAGTWQGGVAQAIAVQAGKPSALPLDRAQRPAQIAASANGLVFSDATTQSPISMAPVTGSDWNFALPGESPLSAAELLDPLLKAAAVVCPVGELPQFRGEVAMDAARKVTFHAFVLGTQHVVLVMQVGSTGAPRAEGVRAVLEFSRE